MSNRLIYVAGTPSGGTSAVAGALYHLGVDMGKFPLVDGVRGYVTFEDNGMGPYKVTRPGGEMTILRQDFRLREYIAERQRLQQPDQRIGFKGSALYWMTDQEPAELEMDVLLVHRPLEHSILSDQRIWTLIPKRDPSREALDAFGFIRRATGIAGAWSAKNLLRYAVTPRAELDYYDLLEDPKTQLMTLCHIFDLDPSEDQMKAAIKFVDPEMRNV